MKWLKAGITPKRGNPNNDEEQEEFDTHEGGGSKQPIRDSISFKEGGGYPSLGPPPDMGLPDDDEEERKSDRSDSDRRSESEESDEPPKKKHEYKAPAPAKPAPSKHTEHKRDKEFYKAIEQAKKHAKNCISNLNYAKVDSSIEDLEKALEILRELE